MAHTIRVVRGSHDLAALTPNDFIFGDVKAALAIAYISAQLDFEVTVRQLQALDNTVPLLAVSTAGELCAEKQGDPLYIPVARDTGDVVLQIFPPDLLQSVQLLSVPLCNADIRSGSFTVGAEDRITAIEKEIEKLKLDRDIDVRDTVALAFIDGLSSCENYFMEAIYRSNRFPCMFVGGSTGGKLDFKRSYVFDGVQVRENHAVIALLTLAQGRSYGALKTQNFEVESICFEVAEADTDRRTVYAIFDTETGAKRPFAQYIAEKLGIRIGDLGEYFKRHTFGIRIGGAYYVRSVSGVNAATGAITFYCDVNAGDLLYLAEATDFEKQTAEDVQAFLAHRPPPLGAVLNDYHRKLLEYAGASAGGVQAEARCGVAIECGRAGRVGRVAYIPLLGPHTHRARRA